MLNDIAMCASTICHLRAKCLRHAESGSKPHPTRQTYAQFDVDYVKNKTCEYFIEKFDEPNVSVWKVEKYQGKYKHVKTSSEEFAKNKQLNN